MYPTFNTEVLVKAEFLSVDPYMRVYMERFPVGTTMIGTQVARYTIYLYNTIYYLLFNCMSRRVLESRNPDFKVGDHVFGSFGWRTHTVFNQAKRTDAIKNFVLPPMGNHSPALAIGMLGISG